MLSKRRKKPSSDRIFLFLAVLLIGYVMFISSDPTVTKDAKDAAADATENATDEAYDSSETSRLDAVKESFDTNFTEPNFAKADPRITNPVDLRRGAGEFALCGNEVTLHYTLLDMQDKVLADSHANDAPLTFRVGSEGPDVMKWIKLHVLGMKAGGLREMTILSQWWSEENPELLPKELKGKLKEETLTKARLELVSVQQDANSAPVFPSTYLRTQGNVNKPLQCGQTVKTEIYNITGWRGEDIEPIAKRPTLVMDLTTGTGNLPKWLEQGIVGNGVILPMMLGGERHIVVPKEMLAEMTEAHKALLAPLAINTDKEAAIAVRAIDPDAPPVTAPVEVKEEPKTDTKEPVKSEEKKSDEKKDTKDVKSEPEKKATEPAPVKDDGSFIPPQE